MFEALKGKRTYITALVMAGLAVADAFGYAVPPAVYAILAALGLTTGRIATAGVANS